MSDAKKRAQERLADMVDKAADVIEASLKGTLPHIRGSTRTVEARYVLDAVLERLPEAPGGSSPTGSMSADELAAKREQLRQARLAERKQA